MAAVEPPLSMRRCPSTGRQGAGRLSPGPMRRGAAPPGSSTSGHCTPLRQHPCVAPNGSSACVPPNGSVPMAVPSPMPRRLNSSSSTSLAGEGCNSTAPWGTGPILGGRSFSTPTGLHMMDGRTEATTDAGGSQGAQPTISWFPPPTARGRETSPSPWAWQLPNGLQSPRAPPVWANLMHPQSSPRMVDPTCGTRSAGNSAMVPPCVAAVPVQTREADTPLTARLSGSMIAPVTSSHPETPLTARMSGSATAPVSNPPAPPAMSGSATAPVSNPPAPPAMSHDLAPPCVMAIPVQMQFPPQATPTGSQATLAADDSNQSMENANVQVPSGIGAPSSAFSPRDSVWKRYFNTAPAVAGIDQQITQSRMLIPQADRQVTPAVGMVCGISRNKSPSGVPRLPLQATTCAQLATPEGVPFVDFAPTERNTLPATERVMSGVPAWYAAPQTAEVLHAEIAPQNTFTHAAINVPSGCEQVRLSEAHYEPSPPGSTTTLSPALGTEGRVLQDVAHMWNGRPSGGLTLQQTMGQFGAPEPPQSIDVGSFQNLQSSQASIKDGSMLIDTRENSILPSPSVMRELSALPSPMPETSTFPDEYMHSFIVATSPFTTQCQGQEMTSFVQPGSGYEVQPLQPRRRGLPGNTLPDDQDKWGGDSGQESSVRKPNRKKACAEVDPMDDIGAAAAAVSLRDLAELRSFRNPPVVVCQVLEPVALLLGVPHKPWARMRKLLDGTLLSRLNSFDPGVVSPAQAERVKCLLQAPAFSDGSLHEKCPAAVGLSHWCRAVVRSLSSVSLPTSRSVNPPPAVDAPPYVEATRPDLGGLSVEPDLWSMSAAELSHVKDLQFSRDGVGSVRFHGETDVLDVVHKLTDIVLLHPGEVVVYPNASTKPPPGVGLNKAADITLFGCMPKTQSFRDQKAKDRYKRRVKQMTEDKGAEFVDYDCMQGIWKFRVNHF